MDKSILLLGSLLVSAIIFVPVLFVGRAGDERRLRWRELILLFVVVSVLGPIIWLAQSTIGLHSPADAFAIPVLQIAIGLAWIRLRKGYFIKPPATEHRPAATPWRTGEHRTLPQHSEPDAEGSALIFLSYRRGASSDVTGRIYDRLIEHFGQDKVFKDVDSIPLGVDFRNHLSDSVARCRLLLAVIGKDWLRNLEGQQETGLDNPRDFVRIEIESALERPIPVIPVLVQGAPLPREEELPASLQPLAYHNAIAVRPDPDFHSDIARLINGIEHHLSTTP